MKSHSILTTSARQFTLWIALLAILMSALQPALFFASFDSAHALIEVCSASGSKQIPTDPTQEGSSIPAPLDMTGHCPDCSLQTHLFALLPEHTMPLYFGVMVSTLARFFPPEPRTLQAWITAQPRAPPGQLLAA